MTASLVGPVQMPVVAERRVVLGHPRRREAEGAGRGGGSGDPVARPLATMATLAVATPGPEPGPRRPRSMGSGLPCGPST
jgi:hypothetical protein